MSEPLRRATPLRGEGGAGQPCRVAVAGNRTWLTADSLAVGCRDFPSVKAALTDSRTYRTHPCSGPRSGYSHPRSGIDSFHRVPHIPVVYMVAPRQLPSFRSWWIHSHAPLRVCLACIALKLPAQPSGRASIHCGTAAVVLAFVVSSGTGGGGLHCICFCCGSIFGSVTSLARGAADSRISVLRNLIAEVFRT